MAEVVLVRSAEDDWFRLYSQYGNRFELPFERAIALLEAHPEAGPRSHIDSRFRRLVLTETNWGIFYQVSGSRLVISILADLRQSSESIARQLSRTVPGEAQDRK